MCDMLYCLLIVENFLFHLLLRTFIYGCMRRRREKFEINEQLAERYRDVREAQGVWSELRFLNCESVFVAIARRNYKLRANCSGVGRSDGASKMIVLIAVIKRTNELLCYRESGSLCQISDGVCILDRVLVGSVVRAHFGILGVLLLLLVNYRNISKRGSVRSSPACKRKGQSTHANINFTSFCLCFAFVRY